MESVKHSYLSPTTRKVAGSLTSIVTFDTEVEHVCALEGYLGLASYAKVILKTTLDIQEIWSCPWYSLGQPGTSKVAPDMVYETIISPRSEMSDICPRTTRDIQACSQHGL